ncbi:hypothetical protein FNF31_04376 [Cafeteria roenbergensis]|uniref:Uncharacterized protein n=1 Tax=Cafeteria roenbergensis TaxID=33653 RepID=A0A5A8D5Z7_CAFRO|nr:hypothetical protein FNF31_04376 [Cafeteria roenbergensis]
MQAASTSIKEARAIVELLSQQNDKYEQELRIQDTQERLFVGNKLDIQAELQSLFENEDEIVRQIERQSFRLRTATHKRKHLEEYVLEQRVAATTVDIGVYNLRTAKQHISILKQRLGVALDHVDHFIHGAKSAKERLDSLRARRALADIKLNKTEAALARAEVEHREQVRATAIARDALADAKYEVRKVQERLLAEKLEFDGAVAEFRRQFLGNMERASSRLNRGKGGGKWGVRAEDPMHVIGDVTLEEEIEMTRRLRSLEDESENIQAEIQKLQRGLGRAEKLLAEIKREFQVPDEITCTMASSPKARRGNSMRLDRTGGSRLHADEQLRRSKTALSVSALLSQHRSSGAAVTPFAAARAASSASSRISLHRAVAQAMALRKAVTALSRGRRKDATGPRSPSPPKLGRWASEPIAEYVEDFEEEEDEESGPGKPATSIEQFIVERFNDAEDGHFTLTTQITEREMEVRQAELALAEARRGTEHYAPGSAYDLRRQACARASRQAAALAEESRKLMARCAVAERSTMQCNEVVARLAGRFGKDIATLANPAERLCRVFTAVESLAQILKLEDQRKSGHAADDGLDAGALAGRFSSLVVAVDDSCDDPLALPSAQSGLSGKLGGGDGRRGRAGNPRYRLSAAGRRLVPISWTSGHTTGSAFIETSSKTGSRKIVLQPNTLRPGRLAAKLEKAGSGQRELRPLGRPELERESVRGLLHRQHHAADPQRSLAPSSRFPPMRDVA